MLVDGAKYGDVEIPVFCYEPKLGQPVGACRMCLVEIEGIPKLQTACSTPVKDGMVVHTQTDRVREAQEAVVEFLLDQPPARLPGLRQGRRVPAAGHLLRLGRRPLALHRAQAPLPQAARALAADRDRPRALHPLLPLRALLAGDLRGLPAGPPGARRAHLRRDLRRPPVRRAVQRQHHRAVPGGRADLAALPLPRAPVGHRGRGLGLHAVPGAVQRRPSRSATSASCACSPATTPGSTTAGCATRAASPTRPSTSTSASREPMVRDGGELRPVSWERALERGRRGAAASAARPRRRDRRRRDDERGGLPPPAPAARGPRLAATRLARRRPVAARAAARARRARRCRRRVAGPRVRPRRARARLRAGRRRADPRPAHPQGRAPPRRAARVASSGPSSLDANARLSLRFAPGAGEALSARSTPRWSRREARRDEVGRLPRPPAPTPTTSARSPSCSSRRARTS